MSFFGIKETLQLDGGLPLDHRSIRILKLLYVTCSLDPLGDRYCITRLIYEKSCSGLSLGVVGEVMGETPLMFEIPLDILLIRLLVSSSLSGGSHDIMR